MAFQFSLLSMFTPRYLNSFDWERAVPLYLNLGCLFCELGRRTERLFLRYLPSYYFSHTIRQGWPMPCLVFFLSLLQPFFYLPRSRRQGRLHIVNIWIEFSSPIRSFMDTLNKVQLVTAPRRSPVCKMCYLE